MANEPVTSPAADSNTPQRHIRTFAQDVARLSGKGMPAAPAVARPPAPSVPPPLPQPEPPPARIIPKAPTTDETRDAVLARLKARAREEEPVKEPVPETPAYIIPKAPSTNESKEDVLARLRAKAAARIEESGVILPEVAPAPVTPSPAPAPLPKERITAPISEVPTGPDRIHTYKSDFREHAEKNDASRITVLAAQADARPVDTVIFKEKRPFPVAVVGGFMLIFLGGGALYTAYHLVTNKPLPVFVARVPSLIVPDEREELRGDLLTEFIAGAQVPLPEGNARIFYTSMSTTTAEGKPGILPQPGGFLFRALSLRMPDILARSIMNETTVGAIRKDGEQRAFFILRVDSFERSFAGMLDWERTMAEDLRALYPNYPAPEPVATTTVSTTPVAPIVAAALSSSFKDELVGNRDVRVLRDTEGRSLILYGFPDKETIIIARDGAAYAALVARLAASRGQ